MSRGLLSVLLGTGLCLGSCTEYDINSEQKPADGERDETGDPVVIDSGEPDSGDPPPPDEACNGVDDDGDGDIDEGFPDTDGDGIADCMDGDCEVALAAPRSELESACEGGPSLGTPPVDPWNTTIEWQFTGGAVYSTPSVGDLDDDGMPEVVTTYGCPSYINGCLAVLDGATGSVEWTMSGIDATGGTALGDLNNDGPAEIVTYLENADTVVALDLNGTELWRFSLSTSLENYAIITDLEGDGDVEVIANQYVLDGPTGTLEATLQGVTSNWGAPAVADMDLDGVQEIMLENAVYSADGTLRWVCGGGGLGTFPHPVNADADPEGEMLVATRGQLSLCDDDGSLLWTQSHAGVYGAAMAIADFDNDGMQEYALAARNAVYLYEPDGSIRWSSPVSDGSGLAGTTSWDIDLDGVPEVIYGDEVDILVLDGATGAVVLRDSNHGSITLAETPAVADVDADGQGELIFGSNGGYSGLTVFGGTFGDWPYARPVYNQYSYSSVNIEDDLTVPTVHDPPWLSDANLFRGQPSSIFVSAKPDLSVEISDVCIASCEEGGQADVALQLWNAGPVDLDPGVVVELYGGDGVTEVLVDTVTTVDVLPAEGSLEFIVTAGHAELGTHLRVVVDPADAILECDELDQEDTEVIEGCP
jgi:hypothetical protein